jgi:flagellar basal body rod protein FlgG
VGSFSESLLIRGLSFLAERQAAIANNLANVDAASFKRRIPVATTTAPDFRAMLDAQLPSIAFRAETDFGRGVTRATDNPFDIALGDDCWLQVRDTAGADYYTRNGQLQIDAEGFLATRDGMRLLDQNGAPLQLGLGEAAPAALEIAPNGTVQDSASGQVFGQLRMVRLDDPQALQPAGRGLWADSAGQVGKPVGDGLQQGFLEGSNVDSLQELVAMITVERSFAATQKALSSASRTQENIINTILR